MGDIRAETTADDAVPGRVVHRVELGLEDLCDVVEDALLPKGVIGAVNCVLLHLFGHVCELHYRVLSLRLVSLDVC